MDKLTDAEIVKALERCGQHRECCYCNSVEECGSKRVLTESCLDLINRQKAEIERYKGVIKILEKDVKNAEGRAVKEFVKYLIDNEKDGVIKTFDLPELVCDFLHPVEKVEHDSLCETETYKG